MADSADLLVQPHKVGWFWRLLGLHNRQFRSTAVAMDVEGSPEDENLQKYMERMLLLGTERRERYKVFATMDTFDIVHAILDLYAEESTQRDYDKGKSIWIESKSNRMVKAGEECFRNVQAEDRIAQIARATARMGDEFRRTLYATGKGVLGWRHALAMKVHRVEDKYSRLIGFREDGQQFRGKLKRSVSWPWDYVHFRLMGNFDDATYGTSMLEALYRPWRQLILAEDAMLMYRLRRAPDRNMVLVDVGNMEESEAQQFLNKWRKKFRKYEFIDPASPNYRKQYNPLTPLEDIFLAMRRDNQTRIETLSGSGNVGELYDLEHYRNKLFGVGRVPKAYMAFEGDINAKATLTQQDVRFARTCKRLQRAVIYGFRQLLEMHYSLLPTNPEDTAYDFNLPENAFMVQMTPISYLDEWERLELVELRYRIVESMSRLAADLKLNPKVWSLYILLNYAKLPEELVQKLMTVPPPPPPAPGAPTGIESLPPRLRNHILDLPSEERDVIMEGFGTEGYTELSYTEQRAIAQAVHQSPGLRRIIGNIAYYHEDDLSEGALQQVDPGILPPTVAGKAIGDDYVDDSEAKQLHEDMRSIKGSNGTSNGE